MKNLSKKLLIVFLLSFCMIVSLVCGVSVPNIAVAENSIMYLYENDGTYTVTASLPKYYATHYTNSNMNGTQPKDYSTSSGVADTYNVDNGQLIMTSKANKISKAVNLTFPVSIPDIDIIENLTINMTVSTNGKTRRKLIMENGVEWFTLYGVNADGTINNNNVGYEFTNTNIPKLNQEVSLTLSKEETQLLANSDGGIETIQWNFWDQSKNISLIISSISYEVISQSQLNEVVFKDFDGNTMKTVYAGSKLAKEYFPATSDFDNVPEGKTLAWKDANGKDYEAGSSVDGQLVLYPTYVKDVDAYMHTFYGNGVNSVSASMPISYISSAASGETIALSNLGQFPILYSIGPEAFSMTAYAGYQHSAVDYTFGNPLTNLDKIKKVVLTMTISPHSKKPELIPDYNGMQPYYRMYALNVDGTVDATRYFDFNDQTVPALHTKVEIVLTHDQLSLLANEEGKITGWQFNVYQFDWAAGQVMSTFTVHSIEYELFADFEYTNVNFYDVDGRTLLDSATTAYTLASIDKEFPSELVTNYPREGYALNWYTQPNGQGECVDETTVFSMGGNVALYAYFDEITYSIVYDYNGAVYVGDGDTSAKYGNSIAKPSNPTRDGYTFAGWYEEGATEEFNFSSMPSRNVVLVADWIPNSFNVTLNACEGSTIVLDSDVSNALYGETFTFRVTVEERYVIAAVYYEIAGEKFTPTLNEDGGYSFIVVAGDVILSTEVAEKYIPFNDILVSGGRLVCEQEICFGESVEFTVKTADGFKLKKLLLNGTSVMHLLKDGKLILDSAPAELNFEIEFELIEGSSSCSSSIRYDAFVSLFVVAALALVVKNKKRGEV